MAMVLEQVIENNSSKKVLNLIEKLEVKVCCTTFVAYLEACENQEKNLGDFEKEFYNKLITKLPRVITDITIANVTDYKATVEDLYLNGFYAYSEYDTPDLMNILEYQESTETAYHIIKEAMQNALTEILQSKEEKIQEQKCQDKARLEARIKTFKNNIAECEKQIALLN